MAKTHWRKILEKDFLSGADLDDGEGGHIEITATIDKATREKVKDQSGEEEDCLVLHFKEKIKPMILNVTNSKTLDKLVDTSYIEDWAGKRIRIGTEKVKAFGEIHDALRIRSYPPKSEETVRCADCKGTIKGTGQVSSETIISGTQKTYGVALCFDCAKVRKEKANAEPGKLL